MHSRRYYGPEAKSKLEGHVTQIDGEVDGRNIEALLALKISSAPDVIFITIQILS